MTIAVPPAQPGIHTGGSRELSQGATATIRWHYLGSNALVGLDSYFSITLMSFVLTAFIILVGRIWFPMKATQLSRLASIAFLAVAACSETVVTPAAERSNREANANAVEKYLPYGVSVPEGDVLTLEPEPYDFRKHGPPAENSIPNANLAVMPGYNLPKFGENHGKWQDPPKVPPQVEAQSTGNGGWMLWNQPGVNARNDAQRDLVVPGNYFQRVTIYAPTHLPHANSCLEATTAHIKASGSWQGTGDFHGFWNWCTEEPSFQVWEETDNSTWASRYIRLYGVNGEPAEEAFYVSIHSTTPSSPVGGCWVGMLYNFNSGVWEHKITSCGASALTGTVGWTMWESHGLAEHNLCPSFPRVSTQWFRKYTVAGAWTEYGASDYAADISTGCFANGIYTMTRPVGPYH